jgi:hypothetical protein
VLPATADVADCPAVRDIWDKYDAWCESMNVPRANHGIVTTYSDGSMNIDYHYDKISTIASDSLITIVKTGEVGRPFQIRQRLYAPWASEVPEAQRKKTPMVPMDATKKAAMSAKQKGEYKADQQRRSAFTKAHNAVKPFFDTVVPVGDALIMTPLANLATEHAVSTVEKAAESGSIVLRTTTEVVPYRLALHEAGGSADPGGGALSTASSAAVNPDAATAAASTAAAAPAAATAAASAAAAPPISLEEEDGEAPPAPPDDEACQLAKKLGIDTPTVQLILTAVTRRAGDGRDASQWDGITGVDHVRCDFNEQYLKPSMWPDSYGTPPSGLLLFGPPGTGKTLIAYAMGAERATPTCSS